MNSFRIQCELNDEQIHRVANFCALLSQYISFTFSFLNDCTPQQSQCKRNNMEFFKSSKNLCASKVKIRLACVPLFHCYGSTTLSKKTKHTRNHSQLTQFCPSFFLSNFFIHFSSQKTLPVNDMRPSLSCAMTISLFHVNAQWRRECST